MTGCTNDRQSMEAILRRIREEYAEQVSQEQAGGPTTPDFPISGWVIERFGPRT